MSEAIQIALSTALERGEIGVQVAAAVRGEQVIDAWAGVAEEETGRAVDGSTLFSGFSIGKALTSLAVHVQAERGLVEYDATVATYWPEYGRNGKEAIRVRHVLSHEAGVPMMPEGTTPERQADWDWVVERLAELTPINRPGTAGGYHNITFGFILGEVVRRTDPGHRPFGQFVQEEILAPLGITDCWVAHPHVRGAEGGHALSARPAAAAAQPPHRTRPRSLRARSRWPRPSTTCPWCASPASPRRASSRTRGLSPASSRWSGAGRAPAPRRAARRPP